MRGISRTPTDSYGMVKTKTSRSFCHYSLDQSVPPPRPRPPNLPSICSVHVPSSRGHFCLPQDRRQSTEGRGESTNTLVLDAPAVMETHSEEGRALKVESKAVPACQAGKGKGCKGSYPGGSGTWHLYVQRAAPRTLCQQSGSASWLGEAVAQSTGPVGRGNPSHPHRELKVYLLLAANMRTKRWGTLTSLTLFPRGTGSSLMRGVGLPRTCPGYK